jgi:hypothetical protein
MSRDTLNGVASWQVLNWQLSTGGAPKSWRAGDRFLLSVKVSVLKTLANCHPHAYNYSKSYKKKQWKPPSKKFLGELCHHPRKMEATKQKEEEEKT